MPNWPEKQDTEVMAMGVQAIRHHILFGRLIGAQIILESVHHKTGFLTIALLLQFVQPVRGQSLLLGECARLRASPQKENRWRCPARISPLLICKAQRKKTPSNRFARRHLRVHQAAGKPLTKGARLG